MGPFFTVGAVEDPPALLLTAAGDLDLRTAARVRKELVAVTGSEAFFGRLDDAIGALPRGRDSRASG